MSRNKKKGPYVKQKIFLKSNILPRSFEITSRLVGNTFNVHSGKSFSKILINNEMIGHKAGEFVFTRANFTFKKSKKKK